MGFKDCWDRTKQATGMKRQKELAAFLGIKDGPVSDAKKRNAFPLEWAYKLSQGFNISLDWILYGEGPMHRSEHDEHPVRPEPASVTSEGEYDDGYDETDEDEDDLTPEEFRFYINKLLSDPVIGGWLQVEFMTRFPELTDRIKKQREVDRKGELARTKAVGE